MNRPPVPRLSALVASLTLALTTLVASRATAASPIPDENRVNGFAIGLQSYTFNRFTAFEAIEKTASAGAKVIEFYPGQRLSKEDGDMKVDHNAANVDAVVEKLKAKLAKHGIRAVNYGVVGVSKVEAEARKVFDFARKLGLYAITTESADAVATLEALAVEYDICVAFHNHPGSLDKPGYKVWNPLYIAGLVEGRDARIGACADVGHWTRSGIKPVDALRILKGRIISAHLKDLTEFGVPSAHDVPFGQGKCNIGDVLTELRAQGMKGNLSIEYEYNWDNSLPEVTQCVAFVRDFAK
ncbi:MAG: sugar phosphate isomerase/epimerase [Verrucomicrobiales bacterium]|nr:sugar phosphate isomerase/epimerase [Verrucomicrobiales bacterium]